MKTERILQSLKVKDRQLNKKIIALTKQKETVEENLAKTVAEFNQTHEAILVLEGKSEGIKEALKLVVEGQAKISERPTEKIPENGLPPAEPGFKWAKNEQGENVLVPEKEPERISPESYIVNPPPIIEGLVDFSDNPDEILF